MCISQTGPDPRTWGREDVVTFLRWCEREFDLPGLDLDKFQMNGNYVNNKLRALNPILSAPVPYLFPLSFRSVL